MQGIKETCVQYYPICLNITNKRCIVVGGGEVGARKVKGLLECGASVSVVGRELNPYLEEIREAGKIEHLCEDYRAGHLRGAFLVIGATDSEDINRKIYEDALSLGIMVNIADDPGRCDFILPAVARQGDLAVAVSTGGKSPALARKLRDEFESSLGPEYGTLARLLGELRKKVLASCSDPADNKRKFEALIESDILRHIREKNWEAAGKCVRDITGFTVELP